MEDTDDDPFGLFSSFPPPNPNFRSYSEKFRVPPSHDDEHHQSSSRKFSLETYDSTTRTPKIFDRFYDSSSDDEFYSTCSANSENARPVHNAGKRLDYMIQYLDRKFNSSENNHRAPLPEFVASGGGKVKLPVRPDRPPSLEFRPRPTRETQIGCFLTRLMCTDDSQLWAGSECGIRFWNLSDMYSPGGDKDAADFQESELTSPTLCLIADVGYRLVWSGHTDGKIRGWKMDHCSYGTPFKEELSWQAHRGPVLSIVITCYGDLWSGSEGGLINIWPWEAMEKSLSLTTEEWHMAGLLIERSYIDLKSQVTVNGTCCNIFASDVKYMQSDHSGAKVWTAGYFSFALWDACSRELLKVFNMDGQIESMSLVQDPTMEEEARMKIISGSKKDKSQSSFSFFQRSRNAIMGAADAVRRVAVKGTFGDDNRRTEALISTIDGIIWTGCTNGLLVQWDGNGNRLQDVHYHFFAVCCFFAFSSRIWVGYASGTVQVLDLNGNLLGEWVAHNSPVLDMAVRSGYIFTLANHGGIRGWSITSPGPLDTILSSELAGKEFLYTRLENLKILAGTWNVGQGRTTHDALISWLGSAAADIGIVVVGLQEVEMGAGFVAMSAARETVGLEGSSVGHWWLNMIGKTLDEGSTFERVGSRQLAGLLIAVWVRNNIRGHVGDVDVAAVPCGLGRAFGNKGAVGLKMRVYGRIICFVNCHFAAHLEAVSRRNADFDHVYRTMMFSRQSNFLNVATAGVSSAIQMLRGANVMGTHYVEGRPELSEADMIVFLGDLNYRLDGISYDEARDFISQRCFDWLRERDQLLAEMKSGNVFQGMREAVIRFPPTYKFERHQAGLAGYDSGEKKRIPAWCDRILYCDSRMDSVSSCSLDCPIVSAILQYEACMDVTDSDHKPVRCIFCVDIARVDESIRRQEFGEIIGSNEKIRCLLDELFRVPEAIVSTSNIILQNLDTSILRITNKCVNDKALFEIICEGQSTIKENGQAWDHHPRGSFGFPRWLKVSPAAGIIKPEHIAEISVHHEEYQTLEEFVDGVPQNWWCEDARDKEVILVVRVRGSCTSGSKSHRIRVRHSLAKNMPMNHKSNNSSPLQANVLHRSDFPRLSSSSDMVDQLPNLRSP